MSFRLVVVTDATLRSSAPCSAKPPTPPKRLRRLDATQGEEESLRSTSRSACRASLAEAVQQAVEGGADCVQLRETGLTDRALFELAVALRAITRPAGAALIVNRRVDVAVACDADGAHLGRQSMGVAEARELLGPGRLVGASTHSLEEARAAFGEGADYVFCGPVFPTPSKEGLVEPIGLAGLRGVCAAVNGPVIGIGGIDAGRAGEVMAAGARGVAVIRAVLAREDPRRAAAELWAAVASAQ